MLDSLTQSFKAHMYERTSSPLFGAFLMSWLVWNYPVVLTVFGEMGTKEKIDYIQNTLYAHTSIAGVSVTEFEFGVYYGLIFPFLSAITFIFVYPAPAKFFYSFWKERQIELQNRRLELEKKVLVTVEQHQKLKSDYFELKASLESTIRERDEEIESLQNSLAESKVPNLPEETTSSALKQESGTEFVERIKTLDSLAENSDNNFDESQQVILHALAELGKPMHRSNLIDYANRKFSINKTKASLAIDELTNTDFVEVVGGNAGLTFKGKRMVVELGFCDESVT